MIQSKTNRSSIVSRKRSSPISRFFVEGSLAVGDIVTFDGGDARKIAVVLRKQSGDSIEIIDSTAAEFRARLQIEGRTVRAELLERTATQSESAMRITVAQGIPKGHKMDFVIEKLTELGVAAIIPLKSERSVVTEIGVNKLERWNRLAKTASQQCGRSTLPSIDAPIQLRELIGRFQNYDLVLFPWELAERVSLRESLPPLMADRRNVLIVIGPEGGFSQDEAQAARDAGAELISLGARILRTETAALVLVSIVNFITAP